MRIDCVVVGAGSAGVTASRALRDAGVDHVVLERGEVAHTWATQRWDSFALNTPGSMNRALGDVDPRGYSTLAETIDLLRRQADGLPIRTHTPVTAVRREGDAFRVVTPDDEIVARSLVVASGPKNLPRLPRLAADLPDHVTSLHTADYRSADALPAGGVLVVGGGQSGAQVAHDLVSAGREVFYAASRVGRYRAQYRGKALLDWQLDAGYWDHSLADLTDSALARVATPVVGAVGRELGLPLLARLGVRLLGRIATIDGSRLTLEGDVTEYVEHADEVALEFDQLTDDHIAATGVDAEPAAPDAGRGPCDVDGRRELDLDAEGITSVVWCTGFGADFSWLDPSLLDASGSPLLDGGASAVDPSVRYVGMPWQSTRASTILHGLPLDARLAAGAITRRLSAT